MKVKKNRVNPFELARKKTKTLSVISKEMNPQARVDLESLICQLRSTVKKQVQDDMAKAKKMNVAVFSNGSPVDRKGFFTKNEKEKIIFVGKNKMNQIEIVTMVQISYPPRLQATEPRRVASALGYKQKTARGASLWSKVKNAKDCFDLTPYYKKGKGYQIKVMDGDNSSQTGFGISISLTPAHLKKIFGKSMGKDDLVGIEAVMRSVLKRDGV